jgi:hypothetical protein
MIKEGVTRYGIRFLFYALRCSGEFDTWLCNTIVSWLANRYLELVNGLPAYNFRVTGDDNFGAKPRGMDIINTYPQFGFECDFQLVNDVHELEFCSAKFVEYYPGKWMLCPDPFKIMRNIGYIKNADFEHCIGHYYYTVGYMYTIMFPNLPFFHNFGRFLMGITRNPKVKHVNMNFLRYHNPMVVDAFRVGGKEVTVSTDLFYIGIEMAYGLQRSHIELLDEFYANAEIDITGHDKKFNRKGSPAPLFSDAQLDEVQGLIEATLRASEAKIARKVAWTKRPR